ncbi:hypothetical protein HY227_01460 [Candidatus Wolfebacteria bacterium]|nr:hypothetical protein [Candidatus Wolfebacteria bacterium]
MFLITLQSRIENNQLSAVQRDGISVALLGIGNTLASITSTITSPTSGLAEKETIPELAPIAAAGEPQEGQINEGVAVVKNPAGPASVSEIADSNSSNDTEKAMASTESILNFQKMKIPGIIALIVIIVAAIIVWIWRKDPKGKKVMAIQNYQQSKEKSA